MDKLFWIDPKRNIKKTYEDLVLDLNCKNRTRRYIFFSNPYDIILELIYSMVLGIEVDLMDSDMSETEIKNLGLNYNDITLEIEVERVKFNSIDKVFSAIDSNRDKWALSIYTSGTTGRPKKVEHTLRSLARSVLCGEQFENNIWAFAYNPTHFAGLQVFFQAFFNRNTMLYIFDMDRSRIEETINRYCITNISATPTFYRSIIPYFKHKNNSITRATLGGERFDNSITASLLDVFPNAKVKNVYASTECGSLFASNGENFKIRHGLEDKVRISEENELLIHEDLLGKTSELVVNNGWYNTGDLVELLDESTFRFVSRKTEMINIGGYKVNPHEIEQEIMKIEGVKDVLVKSRRNRITGNILEAEVVIDEHLAAADMEMIIQKGLKENLQNWKVPRIFRFVNEIEKTRTGKKVRK